MTHKKIFILDSRFEDYQVFFDSANEDLEDKLVLDITEKICAERIIKLNYRYITSAFKQAYGENL